MAIWNLDSEYTIFSPKQKGLLAPEVTFDRWLAVRSPFSAPLTFDIGPDYSLCRLIIQDPLTPTQRQPYPVTGQDPCHDLQAV